jgi:hypothetical protein
MSGLIRRKIATVVSALAKLPAARTGRYKTQFHGNGRFPYKRPDSVCKTYIKLPIVRIQTAIKSSGAWGFKTATARRWHAGERDSLLDLEKISDPGPNRLFPGKHMGCQERPRGHGFNLTRPTRKVSSETRPFRLVEFAVLRRFGSSGDPSPGLRAQSSSG